MNADSRLQGTVMITPEIMITKCFKLLERKVTWKHTHRAIVILGTGMRDQGWDAWNLNEGICAEDRKAKGTT